MGMKKWENGNTYEGEWENGKMSGQGKKKWANGETY
jgi:hypothetical protein